MAAINRPPTPGSSDDNEARELTLEEKVDLQLTTSGEKARLRQLLRNKLEECGWIEEVTQKCREVAAAKGGVFTVEELMREVRGFGRQRVPDHVKAELLQRIRAAILS